MQSVTSLLRVLGFFIFGIGAFFSSSCVADGGKHSFVVVKGIHARPSHAKNGAVFMHIHNPLVAHLNLVHVEVDQDICHHAEIHTHLQDGNVYRMRKIPFLSINPGQTVALKPGGLHIMLMGLKHPLKIGDVFHMKLVFKGKEKNPLVIKVPVKKVKKCGCCKKRK